MSVNFWYKNHSTSMDILLSPAQIQENSDFIKIFDRQFMNLHILACPEHDLTISGKCVGKHCVEKVA